MYYSTSTYHCLSAAHQQDLPVFWENSDTTVSGVLLRGDDLVDIRVGDTSTVCVVSSGLLDFVAMPYNTVMTCKYFDSYADMASCMAWNHSQTETQQIVVCDVKCRYRTYVLCRLNDYSRRRVQYRRPTVHQQKLTATAQDVDMPQWIWKLDTKEDWYSKDQPIWNEITQMNSQGLVDRKNTNKEVFKKSYFGHTIRNRAHAWIRKSCKKWFQGRGRD